jgi:hypothetical protein
VGTPEAEDPIVVSWAQPWPSLSQTQISRLPPRGDSNATFLPSGEYRLANSPLVDAYILSGGPPFVFLSGMWMRQILRPPPFLRAYAKCGEVSDVVM